MSTVPTSATPVARRRPAPAAGGRGSVRRVSALARAELQLLVRNRTALFNALALPPMTVGLFATIGGIGDEAAATTGAVLLNLLTFMALAFVVYYNLTVAFVARREELVLKRYLVGECSRAEILTGTAVPAVAVALAQTVLGIVAVSVFLEPPAFVNPLLMVVAVLGGALMLTVLAGATSGLSRTVESAQLTTLPLLIVAIPFAGLFGGPGATTGVLGTIGTFTPLRPITDLMLLGAGGLDGEGQVLSFAETFGAAVVPVAVLAAWTALGVLACRRWMRWEPRR
ncbi:ABC transporter permease [Krasilnikoviella flava]|uniref:ABC-2 type transport system permease protein n=1 Tax=Krasilnikoviella flava TaxID=526729 RepID=A0A1T5IP50_9MICO|nr:ABC transporter permease [Krasilnikoviella flava]SKC40925.1 ABC-2 type transport system permease protein [Krasilnikoviella flava]